LRSHDHDDYRFLTSLPDIPWKPASPEYLKERYGLPDELLKNISGIKALVEKAAERPGRSLPAAGENRRFCDADKR